MNVVEGLLLLFIIDILAGGILIGFLYLAWKEERAKMIDQFDKERQELLNRLMAKDYSQYASYRELPKTINDGQNNNFLKQSIREAYREQEGPVDDYV